MQRTFFSRKGYPMYTARVMYKREKLYKFL